MDGFTWIDPTHTLVWCTYFLKPIHWLCSHLSPGASHRNLLSFSMEPASVYIHMAMNKRMDTIMNWFMGESCDGGLEHIPIHILVLTFDHCTWIWVKSSPRPFTPSFFFEVQIWPILCCSPSSVKNIMTTIVKYFRTYLWHVVFRQSF